MDDADTARLFELGLGLDSALAGAGAGLTIAALKDLNKVGQPGQIAPSRRMNFVIILAGLGVGTVAVGYVCRTLKLKLQSFVDSNADASSAIRNLTVSNTAELKRDAMKRLSLKDKVDQMYKEEKETGLIPI